MVKQTYADIIFAGDTDACSISRWFNCFQTMHEIQIEDPDRRNDSQQIQTNTWTEPEQKIFIRTIAR